jgi:hypothetical protein
MKLSTVTDLAARAEALEQFQVTVTWTPSFRLIFRPDRQSFHQGQLQPFGGAFFGWRILLCVVSSCFNSLFNEKIEFWPRQLKTNQ